MRVLAGFAVLMAALGLGMAGRAEAQATTTTTTTTSSSTSSSLEADQASAETTSSTDTGARTVESGHALGDEQAILEESEEPPSADDGISARLDETNRDYFNFGFLTRGIVVPDFLIGAFVTYRGNSPVEGTLGGYFAWRRNGLNFIVEAGYTGLYGDGFFHGTSAADTEMEYVRANLGVVFGSVQVQWAVPINEYFAIDIGFGLSLGGTIGNLYRQEATPDSTAASGYRMCTGPLDGGGGYCEGNVERVGTNGRLDGSRTMGGTYQIQNGGGPGPTGNGNGAQGTGPNPFYFGDGGIPPMFGWLDLPRVTARITPIRQLVIRVDLSYNLYGFAFGGSIGYQI